MICINCGKEIEDGAKFCNYCGKRTDGKVPCPSCGKLLPADSLFCSACGKSLSSVSVEKEVAATDAAATDAAAVSQPVGWKKIVTFVSWGCVAFAALMGLIFTFCIGVSAKAAGVGATVTIYDYFGKVYEELGSYEGSSAMEWISLYLPNIFGTVVAAGAIISTVLFSIMATAASVKRFTRKQAVNFEKPAIGLYISFALFATAFLALQATSMSYSGVKIGVNFSDATLAGLALGGIGLGGYFVCKTFLRVADFKDGKVIVKSAVMLGVGVVSIIALSLLALPVLGIRSGSEEDAFGFISIIEKLFYGNNNNDIVVLCCSIAGFAVQILLLIFTVKVVLASAAYVSEGDGKKILPYAITDVVLSAVFLALVITVGKLYLDGTGYGESYKLGLGAPIAVLVLNVVVLVGAIVAVNLFKANRAAQATQEVKEEIQ